MLGPVFLVLLAGIVYVAANRAELDTAPAVAQPQIQPLPAVTSNEEIEPSEGDTKTGLEESAPLPQGKIDVKVACESALLYTTFTDGASADAFVAECIEGKHSDVIERFISEIGIDSATI